MTFQQENDLLLYNILDKLFFKKWRIKNNEEYITHHGYSLELYFTANCNQKCEYCYLQRFKDKLYPREFDKKDLVLHNLRLVYDWIIKSGYDGLHGVDFYSGEIWNTSYGHEVFDITLEYLDKGLPFKRITIPTNASFLLDDESTNKMEEYMSKFKDKGCELQLSLSIDGPYVDREVRALNLKSDEDKRTLDFYEKAFKFCVKHHLCFHPMVAAKSVKYWCENLDWWTSMCDKYRVYFLERVGILEVRNDDWTQENINDLKKFADHYNDYILQRECNGDEKAFVRRQFQAGGLCGGFCTALLENGSQLGCTSPRQLTLRLGDLALCPCHRTGYDELLYGHLNVENDEITNISSHNVYTAMKFLTADVNTTLIGCDACDFKQYCMKQCFGACKEYKNDPFVKEDKVCNMLKGLIYHLVKTYSDKGYYKILTEIHEVDKKMNSDQYNKCIKYRDQILKHTEMEELENGYKK